jgi:hypothetical protein
VQALFESVVVALGSIRLIKAEDAGGYFYDDIDGRIKPPDFRIVTTEGQRLLVEVKAVPPQEQTRPRRLRADDVSMQQRYADLTGARLLVAHYWSAINKWSMVSPSVFVPDGNKLVLSFEDAMKANELAILGDAMLATTPPLTLSLIPAEPVAPGEDGNASFTIADTAIFCDGRRIVNTEDRRLAFFLMYNGEWQSEPVPRIENGLVTRVDFVFVPQGWDEPDSAATIRQQGFAMIGVLSSLHSTFYNAATLTPDGEVRALRKDPVPHSLAELVPDEFWNRPDRDLPIWKFRIRSVQPREG